MEEKILAEPEEPRVLPGMNELNREFWTAGATGELRILRCAKCRRWAHPPRPMCADCHGRELAYEATSGIGTVYSFVVNHRAWRPGLRDVYVIALVELDDQPHLRLTTNLIGCVPSSVAIGMRVSVRFVQQGEFFIPLFQPADARTRA